MSDEHAAMAPMADVDRRLLRARENIFFVEIVRVFLHPGLQFVREGP